MMTPDWLQPYLTEDERVLWTGAPGEKPPAEPHDMAQAAIGLLFLGFGGFILYTLLTEDVPPMLLIPFCILLSLWLLFCFRQMLLPLLSGSGRLRRTEYAVTSRRVLRRQGRLVDALDSRSMPAPKLKMTRSEFGTIRFFGDSPSPENRSSRLATIGSMAAFRLIHIPQPMQALEAIAQMERTAAPAAPVTDTPLLPIDADERVLWQGKPEDPPLFYNVNWSMTFVGLWFVLIAGGMETALILARIPLIPVHLFVWLFIAAGLYLCAGKFLLRRWRMKRTVYVVTDRRILRAVSGRTTAVTVIRDDPPVIHMALGRGGTGTLLIGSPLQQGLARTINRHSRNLADQEGFQLQNVAQAAQVMNAIHAMAGYRKDS